MSYHSFEVGFEVLVDLHIIKMLNDYDMVNLQ
jgi:hypothetical protein